MGAKKKIIGECRLCGVLGELQNSHLLPEFMYEPNYDAKHRMLGLPNPTNLSPDLLQKGIREYLLCAKCELQFSKYEDVVCDLCRHIVNSPVSPNKPIIIQPFDYAAIKLFGISVLWRCAVSTLPECSSVKLGLHQDKMKQMLLHNDPGSSKIYAMFLIKISSAKGTNAASKTVLFPRPYRVEGLNAYRMTALGIEWFITTSSHFHLSPHYEKMCVGMSDKLQVPVFPEDNLNFLRLLRNQMSDEQFEAMGQFVSRMKK